MALAKHIVLTDEETAHLKSLMRQRTIQARTVERAKILLYKSQGMSNSAIADRLDVNINTVKLCIEKFKANGVDAALMDEQRTGRPAEIMDGDIAYVTSIACQRPADLGYAQEVWTLSNLHQHIIKSAEEAGFPRLSTVSAQTIRNILDKSEIKPFKIKYYCEKRDPEFDEKFHDLLVVYRQLSLQFDADSDETDTETLITVHTVSCDEKPGIQAIATTSDDLRPSDKNGCIYRDYEYKRLGTVSLLAGIDLLTGEAVPVVSDTHKSSDFICLLKKLDAMYPAGDIIRIICDNHSIHKSRETRSYLAGLHDGRFTFVFTPKHASWLNLIESFFGKMTRQMLKHIRVKSKQELIDRIYLYFEEINREPVVFHWKYKMDEISKDEAMSAGIKSNANMAI